MAQRPVEFEDFLPIMAEKLGEDGLMEELCNGFRLLMDPRRKLITFDSLKRNAALLGLQGLGDDELRAMLREGDLDGDGALSEMEFCVLMVRLSPELMEAQKQAYEGLIDAPNVISLEEIRRSEMIVFQLSPMPEPGVEPELDKFKFEFEGLYLHPKKKF
ncbi:calcium-binding protein PBP1-like [Elaeis guineensis]|uniref:calcium-binding protein PBP1-like n=1 Tax=Elaeis guineensis var. tenera TaxID=51953 RepID=UPI003C6D7C04